MNNIQYALLGLLFCGFSLNLLAQTSTTLPIQHNGMSRNGRLYVPANYSPSNPTPLVFNLHGYTSNAQQQEFYAGMNAVADTAGFIIFYGNGINNAWNSGFTSPYNGGVDDVGFLSKAIDTLSTLYNIDLTRVYSCGMSNGGFMSFRLACDLEDRIAAVASVTGTMTSLQFNNCTASRAVPVMQVHGTLDPTVAYGGNNLSLSVDSVLNYWRLQNACGNVLLDTLPDINTTDGSTVTTQFWGGCQDGTEVLHYKVANGGHTWPGASINLGTAGNTNRDFNASVAIWQFFLRHSHPGPTTGNGLANSGEQAQLEYGPNPMQEKLHLRAVNEGEVVVRDVVGKLVWKGFLTAGETLALSTKEWPVGVYLLQFAGETHRLVRP